MIELLGLEFADLTLAEATERLLARPAGAPFDYAVTPNADHLVRLRRYPLLRPLYLGAMLCLLDSRFIARLARALGLPCPAVVTGADLAAALLTRMQGNAAVIGMRQAGLAALRARYPRVTFLHHEPPQRLLHDPLAFAAARDFAVRARADFVFIALGSPLQELLAASIAAQPEAAGTGLCIGAALEFCAGLAPRAPAWMRRAGLEWLHRLGRDPWRLAPRYLARDPEIIVALVAAGLKRKHFFF